MLPIFITGNQRKVDYLSKILDIPLQHQKIELDEIQSVDPRKVVEHKVKQAYKIVGKPVLVEDVSLVCNALNGLPGPFIKFFVEAENGVENLCRMLDGFADRSAYGSVLYGYYDGTDMQFIQGKLEGKIAQQPRGRGGYGWDQIFEPDGYGGLTRAELDARQDIETYCKLRDIDALRALLQTIIRSSA